MPLIALIHPTINDDYLLRAVVLTFTLLEG